MIKAGQVYQSRRSDLVKRVITNADDAYGILSYIDNLGLSGSCRYSSWSTFKLIVEFPTWQEAVNSKEFNG